MNVSSEKISLTPSQAAVLGKYLLEDRSETCWEDVARRTSKFVADAEKTPALQKYWEEQFYSIIASMKFMPGGSIIANADHGTKGMMNCFVLSADDSISDITKLTSDAILTTKFRGGVGINIGSEGQPGYIRPKGAPFKDGKALGPCAVLDMVSDNCKRLTTGNKARRGAFLFSMDWRHPDIWEFISAKTQSVIDASVAKALNDELATVRDTGNFDSTDKILEQFRAAWTESHLSPDGKRDRRWHNANISVQLDDEFFATLWEVGEVEQRFERDFDDIDRMGLLGYDYTAKLRWVKELWDAIAICAHATADPGLLLIDNAKRKSPIRDFILCCNPCVTADTWVHTGDGPRQVKNLIGIQHSTYVNGELFSTTPSGFFATGVKPVFKLETHEGFSLRLTGNHKLLKVTAQTARKQYSQWVEAEQLRPGDKILLHDHRTVEVWGGNGTLEEGWLLGTLLGDGCFGVNNRKQMQGILSFWGNNCNRMAEYAVELLNKIETRNSLTGRCYSVAGTKDRDKEKATICTVRLARLAAKFGMEYGNKTITPVIEQASYEFYRGFLRGLFDTDGSVQGWQEKGVSIRLAQSNLAMLKSTQRMLARMGIVSTIYQNRRLEQKRMMPDGNGGLAVYTCQAQHELIIANDNIQKFADVVGFQDPDKNAKLQSLTSSYVRTPNRERFTVTIKSLTSDSTEEVYDCTVPGAHQFDANGIVAHNCGELWLPKDSACDLGSIVLTKFVKQLDCGGLEIDWKDLERTIEIAVRFLDNVLDKSEFATPEQKHSVQNVFRQIGLGIMGWADYLKLARIPYDSQSHLDEIDRWGYFIATRAYRASEALAEEKGVCGIWKEIRGVETFNIFERWYNPDTGEEVDGSFFDKSGMIQRPRRNSTVLSIAPTGSIAQLSGASWAFEPDFGLSIWKQVFVDASAHKQQWVQILNPHVEELGLDDRDRELVLKTGSVQQTEWAHSHPLTASAFKIAKEIAPGWHVLVQSRWQKWIDSSISKTINLPAETTVEQIKEIYLLANKVELKGITVYREGTLESEPIVVGGKT